RRPLRDAHCTCRCGGRHRAVSQGTLDENATILCHEEYWPYSSITLRCVSAATPEGTAGARLNLGWRRVGQSRCSCCRWPRHRASVRICWAADTGCYSRGGEPPRGLVSTPPGHSAEASCECGLEGVQGGW